MLVLFQEIFGVNEHIRAVAEQYALDGFVVLAPDVFWRSQPRVELGYAGPDREQGLALAQLLKPEQLMLDLRAAIRTLRCGSGGTNVSNVGVSRPRAWAALRRDSASCGRC